MAALTGHFEADFASFATAVDGVLVKLRGFEADSNKVGASLNRMTDSFSGQTVIQQAALMVEAVERLGGTAQLTEKELARLGPTVTEAVAKMKLLGMEVPANMQAIAKETQNVGSSMTSMGGIAKSLAGPMAALFSAQAVMQFATEVLAAGDAIQKMADQTGLATDEVQQLMYITGQSGSSMQSLISAAQGLQERLGSGDKGVVEALKRMNINLADFKALGTYEQMLQLSDGIRAVKDPTDQAALAADLFKKSWKELLPTLKSDMRALGEEAPKMSQAAVEGLDRMGDAMTASKQQAIAWAGEAFGAIAKVYDKWVEAKSKIDNLGVAEDPKDPLGFVAAFAAIPPLQAPVIAGLKEIKLTTQEIAAIEKQSDTDMAARFKAEQERIALEKEAQKATEAYWRSVGALVDEAFGVKKLEAAAQWDDAMRLLNDDVSKLSEKMRGELTAAMQEAIAVMAANGTLTQEQSTRYAHLALSVDAYNQSLLATKAITLEVSGTVTAYTQALYDAAVAEDRQRDAAAQKNAELGRTVQAANDAAAAMNAATQYSLMNSMPSADSLKQAASYPGSMLGLGAPSRLLDPKWGIPGSPGSDPMKLQFRAAGGPVNAGQSYIVGEQGPELFTPGRSGSISPNGGGAVVVNNTFHIVDTAENIARRASDLIARSITQARRV